MNAAVALRGVSKSFGERASSRAVLKEVDLSLASGSYTAIMGRSGSGKSTLLNVIGALTRADSGSVQVCGTDLVGASEEEAARFRAANVGFVFQAFHLLPRLTAWENVAVPLLLAGRGRRSVEERARSELARSGLSDLADRLPASLSGGQQQRVAIARALVGEPALVLADEPTGNLDITSTEEILNAFDGIRRDYSATILVVTHEQGVAERAGATAYMMDGQLHVGQGSAT